MSDDTTSKRMLDAINLRDARVKNASGDKTLRAYQGAIEGYRSLAARALPRSSSIRQAGGNIVGDDSRSGQFLTQKKPAASAPPTSTPDVPAPRAIDSAADLGPIVRKARKRMKLSQDEFASYAGVGRRFLSELEGGKSSVEFDKVLTCARAAGIDICARPRHG